MDGCLDCDVGSANNVSGYIDSSCPRCPPGQYTDAMGQAQCTPCPPGPTALRAVQARELAHRGVLSQSCRKLTMWFTGLVAPLSGTSTEIVEWYYTYESVQRCEECAAGKYAPSAGMARCLSCPSGTFSAGSGNVGCTACGSMKTSAVGSTSSRSCASCAAGGQVFTNGACVNCPSGTS